MTEWSDLTPGKRFLLFYVLFLVILGVITVLLFMLENTPPEPREAMVILVAALFGNLLYDQAKMAFSTDNKEENERRENKDKERNERLDNIERIVKQWDRDEE